MNSVITAEQWGSVPTYFIAPPELHPPGSLAVCRSTALQVYSSAPLSLFALRSTF